MTSDQALMFSRTLAVPPEYVYRAFTNATVLREWLCDGAIANAREGSSYHLWWNDGYYTTGAYSQLEANRTAAFSWQGKDEPPTQVRVNLAEKDGGTQLTLTHDGEGEQWAATREGYRRDWENSLENLQSVLETGIDLRQARRPMLGILIGSNIDAAEAKKRGLPIKGGAELAGVIDGMGAKAAGLQTGDIVVQMGETPVEEYRSFGTALSGRRAGDVVEVAYYRGSEKRTAQMTLSHRLTPDVPPSGKELAAQVEKIFADLDTELEGVLQGVTDEEASHNPAPGEWSVKQVLSHLIHSERDTATYTGTLIEGDEWIGGAGNNDARVNALIATFPTLPALLAELRRSHAEIVAMLAGLPDEFVARKGSYMRMGQGLLQTAFHPQAHYDQIRAALEATRK